MCLNDTLEPSLKSRQSYEHIRLYHTWLYDRKISFILIYAHLFKHTPKYEPKYL